MNYIRIIINWLHRRKSNLFRKLDFERNRTSSIGLINGRNFRFWIKLKWFYWQAGKFKKWKMGDSFFSLYRSNHWITSNSQSFSLHMLSIKIHGSWFDELMECEEINPISFMTIVKRLQNMILFKSLNNLKRNHTICSFYPKWIPFS